MSPDVERVFAAKDERRRRLAALPVEEKLRIVVELQTLAAPILRARGVPARIWYESERLGPIIGATP